ncbi:MAG: hypothetical protein AUK47_03705 [Deltaproteobacteria bacterium CG2_30_63_29]|nr:MAG: hypothetical protein AUK47_03705 [Deltaproteobacteria bacterium CG2_30_63_29]
MAENPLVFIVDDEPLVPLALKPLLNRLGFSVCGTATNEREALLGIAETRPDCVVVDLRLFEGNGIALISELRRIDEVWPRCVVLTGHVDLVLRRLAQSIGADHFVIKGTEPLLLVEVLREVTSAGFERPPCDERVTREEMEVFYQLPTLGGPNVDPTLLKSLMKKLKATSVHQLKVAATYLQTENSSVSTIGF